MAGNVMMAVGAITLLGSAGTLGVRMLAARDGLPAAEPTKSPPGEMILIESARPFYLGKTEVTVAAYRACVDAGACTAAAPGRDCNGAAQGRDDHPINCVDHAQAEAYCTWIGGRLPTDAEWQYAACGSDGKLPWDEPSLSSPPAPPEVPRGCYGRAAVRKQRPHHPPTTAAKGTCAVTDYPEAVTTTGLLGMAANVSEWTSTEAPSGSNRYVDAGGHWAVHPYGRSDYDCGRSTSSSSRAPTYRDEATGFRCARSVPGPLLGEEARR